MTEVEIYDTTQPADPTTGERPVKARIRQRHGEESRSRARLEETASGTAEATEETAVERLDTQLSEVTETATRAPSLWERAKVASQVLAAIMILAAAGWIIFKIFAKAKR